MTTMSILIPCYNEAEALEETTSQLLKLLGQLQKNDKISADSRICYIDDGSKDGTWEIIDSLNKKYSQIIGIKLSRNMGQQNALLAGLHTIQGDVFVCMDADLQDDLNVIEKMLDEHENGAQIVYGVRENRQSDTAFKRLSAHCFYRIMQYLGVDMVFNHSEFRLMSRVAVEALNNFEEVNLFLRGMVPLLGYKTAIVHYKRSPRIAGKSKYPLTRMIAFALEGITSFSAFPLRLISVTGFLIFSLSMFMGIYVLCIKLFTEQAVPGWASTVLPIYFLGGIQIMFIGIVGEYIGKIYKEVKRRPRYIIEKITGQKE